MVGCGKYETVGGLVFVFLAFETEMLVGLFCPLGWESSNVFPPDQFSLYYLLDAIKNVLLNWLYQPEFSGAASLPRCCHGHCHNIKTPHCILGFGAFASISWEEVALCLKLNVFPYLKSPNMDPQTEMPTRSK